MNVGYEKRYCLCTEWQYSFDQIVQAQILAFQQGFKYTGYKFKYCPWCKAELKIINGKMPEDG